MNAIQISPFANSVGVSERASAVVGELKTNDVFVLDIHNHELASVLVQRGRMWVTMEGDSGDYIIGAEQGLSFNGPGRLVLEALEPSDFVLRFVQKR